jgi:hypothetical protein
MAQKNAPAVKKFDKPATKKQVVPAVRIEAKQAMDENPIAVERNGDVEAVRCNVQKRIYYALDGRAKDVKTRKMLQRKNAKAIEAAKAKLDTMLTARGWDSVEEMKTWLRSQTRNGRNLFDAKLDENGKIVW